MKKLSPRTREILNSIGLIVLTFFVIFGLFGDIIDRFDKLYFDKITGLEKPSSQITIVAIDEKTLNEYDQWPIERSYYGDLINKLNEFQADTIGVNIILDTRSEDDTSLQEAIDNSSSSVIFASDFFDNQDIFEVNYGYTNLLIGSDGNIRNLNLSQIKENNCINSFGLSIYASFENSNISKCDNGLINLGGDRLQNNIYFETANEDFNTVSMIDVLNENVPAQLFTNKIVLVGIANTNESSQIVDNLTIHQRKRVPSIEVHANIINTLIKGSQKTNNLPIVFSSLFVLSLTLLLIYIKFKSVKLIILISIIFQFISVVLGLFLYEAGYLYPFVSSGVVLGLILATTLIVKLTKYINQTDLLKEAFTRYVSKDVLTDVIKSNDTNILVGKKQTISILFCDIRNFTNLSEQKGAEEIFKILNIYFGEVSKIIVKNRGTLDKYMGDAVMAFWNAPLENKDHGLLTVLSAIEIIQQIKNLHLDNNLFEEIKVGIGLNTGEVLVGNLGSDIRYDYTVIGDEVNLASRLENLTKKYGVEILIGHKTYLEVKESLPDNLITRLIDEIRVKGRSKPSKIYQVCDSSNKELFEDYENAYLLYKDGLFKECAEYINSKPNLKNDGPTNILVKRLKKLKHSNKDSFDYIWNWDEK